MVACQLSSRCSETETGLGRPGLQRLDCSGCKSLSPLTLERVDKPEGQVGFAVQPRRWVVERTFAWLGRGRRLSKDYEKLPENSESVVYIGSIRLLLKRLSK